MPFRIICITTSKYVFFFIFWSTCLFWSVGTYLKTHGTITCMRLVIILTFDEIIAVSRWKRGHESNSKHKGCEVPCAYTQSQGKLDYVNEVWPFLCQPNWKCLCITFFRDLRQLLRLVQRKLQYLHQLLKLFLNQTSIAALKKALPVIVTSLRLRKS